MTMSTLWDLLPPEIQLYIWNFAVRLRAADNPLRPCHPAIQLYYFDPDKHAYTWPFPCSQKGRSSEEGVDILFVKNQFGCIRYMRSCYRANCANGPYLPPPAPQADITQAELPHYYLIKN
jgi:hypothetical protein